MKIKTAVSAMLFVVILAMSAILGIIPLSATTPIGTISLEAQEAKARARTTPHNRLSDIRVPTKGANLAQKFNPTQHNYRVTLHQSTSQISLEPRRSSGQVQQVRHRLETRNADGSWRSGAWSKWRAGSSANNRINVKVNSGRERRVRIAVRDRNKNTRSYVIMVRRATSNTWGASLSADTGTLNRKFDRTAHNYTLNIPANKASVNVRMTGEHFNSPIQTRVGTSGNWSSPSLKSRSRTVSVPQGGTRVLQFRITGAFSQEAPSSTHTRIYTVTINRAAASSQPSAPTTAVPNFTFTGAGWGHGVGMSQNGAMQMAREGRSFSQILNHYFTGITIAERTPQGNMRVNLDSGRSNRTTWTIGPRNGTADAAMIINGRNFNGTNGPYTFSVSGGNIRMTPRTGTAVNFGNKISITSNGSGSNRLLTVMDASGPPLPTASQLFVRYRGTLELAVVSGKLRLVNELPMQEYLYGVVPREIPTSAGVRSAVEAQAIAARSYAHGYTRSDQGVASTVSFQVYGGHSRFASEANWRTGTTITNLENSVSNEAVDRTGNRVILFNGAIAHAYYSACNGDRTANSEDVWSSKLGYTRSVADVFCGRSGHAGHNWTVTMTGMQLASTLRDRGATVPRGAGSSVYVQSLGFDRATGGWVKTLTVNWSDGSTTKIGNADTVRSRLGFRSANFSVVRSTTATATTSAASTTSAMSKSTAPIAAFAEEINVFAGFVPEVPPLDKAIEGAVERDCDSLCLSQEMQGCEHGHQKDGVPAEGKLCNEE